MERGHFSFLVPGSNKEIGRKALQSVRFLSKNSYKVAHDSIGEYSRQHMRLYTVFSEVLSRAQDLAETARILWKKCFNYSKKHVNSYWRKQFKLQLITTAASESWFYWLNIPFKMPFLKCFLFKRFPRLLVLLSKKNG